MAQRATKVVIENVVPELLKGWQSRFSDLKAWWHPATSTTFTLYLVSSNFSDLTQEDLQGLRDELQFALEAETDCNWEVVLLTPDDVEQYNQALCEDRRRLAETLQRLAEDLNRLANQIWTDWGDGWKSWIPLIKQLEGHAEHFYNRFWLYRGWNNRWVKAAHMATKFMKKFAKDIPPLQGELVNHYRQHPAPQDQSYKAKLEHQRPIEEAQASLRRMGDALQRISNAFSGEEPDVQTLMQLQRGWKE